MIFKIFFFKFTSFNFYSSVLFDNTSYLFLYGEYVSKYKAKFTIKAFGYIKKHQLLNNIKNVDTVVSVLKSNKYSLHQLKQNKYSLFKLCT